MAQHAGCKPAHLNKAEQGSGAGGSGGGVGGVLGGMAMVSVSAWAEDQQPLAGTCSPDSGLRGVRLRALRGNS